MATVEHTDVSRPIVGRVRRVNAGDTPASMGDGSVTSFSDNGGKILTKPVIVLIFWGSAWGDAKTSPSQAEFTAALTDIVNGPWGTQLSQYRGIQNLTFERALAVTSSDPQTSFTDPQIVTFLKSLFDDKTLNHGDARPASAFLGPSMPSADAASERHRQN